MKLCEHGFCRDSRITELWEWGLGAQAQRIPNRKVECRLIEQSTAGVPAKSEMLTGRQGRTK